MVGLGVGSRGEGEEVGVEGGDAGVVVGGGEHGCGVGVGEADAAAGPGGDGVAGCEGAEAAGPELYAADPAAAGQRLGEEAEADAGDLGEGVLVLELLEDEVDRGVRDDVGGVRPVQVPVDQPVVLQVGAQRRGRFAAPEADAGEQFGGVDDASGVAAWGGHAGIVGRATDIDADASVMEYGGWGRCWDGMVERSTTLEVERPCSSGSSRSAM